MFQTAEELYDPERTRHNDFDVSGADPRRGFAARLGAARKSGLAAAVDAAGGVEQPVRMRHFAGNQLLVDGHHRVAVAHKRNPKSLLPVLWD